jgi:hypothetical protein
VDLTGLFEGQCGLKFQREALPSVLRERIIGTFRVLVSRVVYDANQGLSFNCKRLLFASRKIPWQVIPHPDAESF